VLDFKDATPITWTRDPRCAQLETASMALAALATAMLFVLNLSAYLTAVVIDAPAGWFGAGAVLAFFVAVGVYATVRATFEDQSHRFTCLIEGDDMMEPNPWPAIIAALSALTILFAICSIACFAVGLMS
jgi:hypothetical protein